MAALTAEIRSSEASRQYRAAYAQWLNDHTVYVLQYGEDGLIKIGYASDVRQRMKGIQPNCPLWLNLLGWTTGGRAREARLHQRFAAAKAWNEWFRPTPDLLAFAADELNHDEPPVLGNPPDRSALDAVAREVQNRRGFVPKTPLPGA